jgi:hypothetical protein
MYRDWHINSEKHDALVKCNRDNILRNGHGRCGCRRGIDDSRNARNSGCTGRHAVQHEKGVYLR